MSANVNGEMQETSDYSRLRAKLIEKGTNITRWAKKHGLRPSTVYDAARGTRNGIKAVRIRKKLEAFANG